MTLAGLAGALGWCLMWLAFIVTRTRVAAFNLICLMVLAGVGMVLATGLRPLANPDAAATLAGLALLWASLVILRAMLSRSVSLHLLMCFASGQDDGATDGRIASRLDDAVRFGLAARTADGYTLSRAGGFLAFLVGTTYASLGLRK